MWPEQRGPGAPGKRAGPVAGASLAGGLSGSGYDGYLRGEEVRVWAGEEVASDRKAKWARAG